ncbi:hypothetical protein [Faecalibaculum rodentium]|uniref:hypothetical protein n=1 Tax=Faecalibaculum rodentium TaxID=1702221 RepID=UPI003F661D3F
MDASMNGHNVHGHAFGSFREKLSPIDKRAVVAATRMPPMRGCRPPQAALSSAWKRHPQDFRERCARE